MYRRPGPGLAISGDRRERGKCQFSGCDKVLVGPPGMRFCCNRHRDLHYEADRRARRAAQQKGAYVASCE